MAEKLVVLRERLGVSREEVANEVDVSVSAISMYENGDRIPRDDIKIKLASYYGRSVEDIFFAQERHI